MSDTKAWAAARPVSTNLAWLAKITVVCRANATRESMIASPRNRIRLPEGRTAARHFTTSPFRFRDAQRDTNTLDKLASPPHLRPFKVLDSKTTEGAQEKGHQVLYGHRTFETKRSSGAREVHDR